MPEKLLRVQCLYEDANGNGPPTITAVTGHSPMSGDDDPNITTDRVVLDLGRDGYFLAWRTS